MVPPTSRKVEDPYYREANLEANSIYMLDPHGTLSLNESCN